MQNKTDKILDEMIKNIDFDKVYETCRKKVQTWNGELSEAERIKMLKNGSVF